MFLNFHHLQIFKASIGISKFNSLTKYQIDLIILKLVDCFQESKSFLPIEKLVCDLDKIRYLPETANVKKGNLKMTAFNDK